MKIKLVVLLTIFMALAVFSCSTGNEEKALGTIQIFKQGNPVGPNNPANTGDTLIASYGGKETVSYQWKLGGVVVGENRSSYIAEDPGSYTVTVSAPGYPSKTSAAVNVGGQPLPELPGTLTITVNGSAASAAETGDELTAVYSGSEAVSYRWFKGGAGLTAISSPLDTAYIPIEAGSYTVRINASGYRVKTSDPVAVTGPTLITITFDLNDGGYDPPTKIVAPGVAIGTLPAAPPRNGFSFVGWEKSDGTALTEQTSFDTPTTVYARWTFSGGTPYIDAETDTLIHENPLMEKGLSFAGSISDEDGTISFTAGAFQYKFPTVVEGVSIDISDYAYFMVFVELKSASGSVSGVILKQYGNDTDYGGKDGNDKYPWLSNEGSGIRFAVSGAGTTGGFSMRYNGGTGNTIEVRIKSITFHKQIPHTVTFALDGGTGTVPASITVYDGDTLGAQFPANPTKTDYTFIGWKNGDGAIVTATTPIKGSWTLTAQWILTSELGAEWIERIDAVATSAPVYGFQLPTTDTFADYDRITVKLTRKDTAFTGNNRLRAWGAFARTEFMSGGNFSASTRPSMGNDAAQKLLSSTGPSADNGVTGAAADWTSYTLTLDTAAKTSQAATNGLLLIGIGVIGQGGDTSSTRSYYIKDITLTNAAGTKTVSALRPDDAALWGDAGKGAYVATSGSPTRTILPYEQD